MRDALQQHGDVLVRSRRGLGEMPGAACGLSAVMGSQNAVDGALLAAAASSARVAFDSTSWSDRGPSRRPSAVVSASRCH